MIFKILAVLADVCLGVNMKGWLLSWPFFCNLVEMKGEELYFKYVKQGGDYSQTLQTAFIHFKEGVFDFLEECEKEEKKLELVETMEGVLDPPLKMVVS